jgi:hypothetical protein
MREQRKLLDRQVWQVCGIALGFIAFGMILLYAVIEEGQLLKRENG